MTVPQTEQISMSLLEEKIELIEELENMKDEANKNKTVDELEKAIKKFDKSTELKKWDEDGNDLDDMQGKKVFKDQVKGIKHILKILKDAKESNEFLFKLANLLLDLVDIDEELAVNKLLNAQNSLDIDEKCLDIAEKELEKAEKDESKDKYDKAIEHYGKSWENSLKSINDSECGK